MFSLLRKIKVFSFFALVFLSTFNQATLYVMATKGSYPGSNGLIAFSARDPNGTDFEIFIMNDDGTGVTQLTFNDVSDVDPCWSPDGEWIAFVSRIGDKELIMAMRADGTGLRQVTDPPGEVNDERPAWSPDGELILFYRPGDPSNDIYKVNPDILGSEVKLISDATSPSWSPDGSMIAYVTDESIWVADSNGTPQFQVTSDGRHPCWSPDGQRIAYSNNSRIHVVDLDGSDDIIISSPSAGEYDGSPNWSPDGEKIIFERKSSSIWIMTPDGSNAQDLTPGMSDAKDPDWQTIPPEPEDPPVGGELIAKTVQLNLAIILAGLSALYLLAGTALKKNYTI